MTRKLVPKKFTFFESFFKQPEFLSDKKIAKLPKTIDGTVSGKTQVSLHNDGGLGAQTTGDGILIVQTTNSTIAAGADFWAPTNSVKAGLYAYNVVRGTQSTDNW
ncbi:autotransporter outer membrane beta-barrel domain-containing protein, partial [Microvirga sp. W0021]